MICQKSWAKPLLKNPLQVVFRLSSKTTLLDLGLIQLITSKHAPGFDFSFSYRKWDATDKDKGVLHFKEG